MNRTDIINHLIKKNNYKTYLEIGVWDKELNFNKVECKEKYWCDPREEVKLQPNIHNGEVGSYPMTSDRMFELKDNDNQFHQGKEKIDLIFIDGLHLAEQVKKDIRNSINYLSDKGTIVVHDCNPPTFEHAQENWILSEWCGTVWKGWVEFRNFNRSWIYSYTIDTDYGVGIIRQRYREAEEFNFDFGDTLTWEVFDKERNQLLNLISVEEFLKK